jgi:hypothetical protein
MHDSGGENSAAWCMGVAAMPLRWVVVAAVSACYTGHVLCQLGCSG